MQPDASVSGGREAIAPGDCRGPAGARVPAFAAVAIQSGLIMLLVQHWKLENLTFARLLQLAFVGFMVHHLLPFRFRLPFFALFSLAGIFLVLVPWPGALAGKVPMLELLGPASALGLKIIDLTPAFEGIEDRRSLYLTEGDEHTNARGHRLLADTLYPQLAPLLGAGRHGGNGGSG
jgi:hypothetical protein